MLFIFVTIDFFRLTTNTFTIVYTIAIDVCNFTIEIQNEIENFPLLALITESCTYNLTAVDSSAASTLPSVDL